MVLGRNTQNTNRNRNVPRIKSALIAFANFNKAVCFLLMTDYLKISEAEVQERVVGVSDQEDQRQQEQENE